MVSSSVNTWHIEHKDMLIKVCGCFLLFLLNLTAEVFLHSIFHEIVDSHYQYLTSESDRA